MDEQTRTTADETRQAPGCFMCLNVAPFLRNIWSENTRGHFRNSRIEFLKGVRSIIDDRIDRLSRKEARGTNVVVD
ncbi:MAG TPA: hypothetical protein VN442_13065 [Bryobacteraceae bacterium]|nr:hypothetical protein [Bryobacteraceae bacterium]